MADTYIDIPITVDAQAIYNIAVAAIQEEFPSWIPVKGGLTDTIMSICAGMAAPGAEVASDVPASIFRYFGPLVRVPPLDASAATVLSTWTVQDTNGYEIPSGTPVGLISSTAGGDPWGFKTVGLNIIPPGSTSITNVLLVASIVGAGGSGLDSVVRGDSLGYVTDISLIDVSINGNDAEDDTSYLTRLSQELETLSTTPILGRDFALIARSVPGVYRCAYWDNYNPSDGTTNNEKMVAISPIDIAGNAVSSGIKAAVTTLLESLREVNFILNVVDPTYFTIDVSYHIFTIAGYDGATVDVAVKAAIQAFLNPAAWGIPTPPGGENPTWTNTPIIRLNKLIRVIEDVAGVDYVEPITMQIHGVGSLAAADLTMTGAFSLPISGTLTSTVN